MGCLGVDREGARRVIEPASRGRLDQKVDVVQSCWVGQAGPLEGAQLEGVDQVGVGVERSAQMLDRLVVVDGPNDSRHAVMGHGVPRIILEHRGELLLCPLGIGSDTGHPARHSNDRVVWMFLEQIGEDPVSFGASAQPDEILRERRHDSDFAAALIDGRAEVDERLVELVELKLDQAPVESRQDEIRVKRQRLIVGRLGVEQGCRPWPGPGRD